jgi:MFS family permease
MGLLLAKATLPSGIQSRLGWMVQIREGVAHVAERPALRRLMVAQGGLLVACTLAVPIEVVYASESLDAGDEAYGLLLAAWGCGMVAGSLIFAHAAKARLPRLMIAALATIAAGYALMAGAPTLAIAAAGAGLGGIGNGISVVAMLQTLQERLHESLQARVMSLWEGLGAASIGVGYLLGGVLATLTSPRLVFAVAAVAVALVAVLLQRALPAERPDDDVSLAGARKAAQRRTSVTQ